MFEFKLFRLEWGEGVPCVHRAEAAADEKKLNEISFFFFLFQT